MALLVISLGLLLDQWLGEPKRYHPLVGFGNFANQVEQRFNRDQELSTAFFLGLTATFILIVPLSLAGYLISSELGPYSWIFSILVVYSAVGFKSLIEHSERVYNALPKKVFNAIPKNATELASEKNLDQARYAVSLMVSRNTEKMSQAEITSASIESSLENGCDSTFAVLFWFLIGGVPMVICYRLTNTLDAMWGYRTKRFEFFGKSAAKLDDVLNYIPARITALFYAICGNSRQALDCWRTQARSLASPNGGPVMTSGAGSLNIRLGGPASYQGERLDKPFFGTDITPQVGDITRTNKLLGLTLLTWLAAIALVTAIHTTFYR
ncbi:MAG: adenosylcobinamide-phosphate synthase [Arenicella sp.]|jgi:adenosylcobinamide-phosphate synthase